LVQGKLNWGAWGKNPNKLGRRCDGAKVLWWPGASIKKGKKRGVRKRKTNIKKILKFL